MRVVADASVIVEAWTSTSSVADECRKVLAQRLVHVPELVFSEVSHVLRKQERLTSVDMSHHIDSLISSPWSTSRYEEYARVAWRLRHDVTMYDASYLALSIVLRLPLVTLDRKLASVATRYCEVVIPGE